MHGNTRALARAVLRAALCVIAAMATFNARALSEIRADGFPTTRMGCLIDAEPFPLHFSLLLVPPNPAWPGKFDNYCQDVPATGTLYLTIDLLDREARTKPIALRVVAESPSADGKTVEERAVLLAIPERIYSSGTAEVRLDITRPGHYALVAIVAGMNRVQNTQLRIPFRVAVDHPLSTVGQDKGLARVLAFSFLGIMLLISYCVHRGTTCTLASLGSRWLKTERTGTPDRTS